MAFVIKLTTEAVENIKSLEADKSLEKRLKAVRKALAFLENNPRHPGLNTHKFHSFVGPKGEEVFEAYAENNTPVAYRIFWYYGPHKNEITILAIVPHP